MTRRLLLSYLSITAFVLLVLELPLGVTFARAERDRLVAAVERDATVLATVVEDSLETGATGGLEPVAAGYRDRTGGRVVVVDRTGITVADSDPPAPGRRDLSTRPEIAAALQGQHSAGSRSSSTLGGTFLYVAVPVASQGQVYGAVRITYPTSAVDARVRRVCLALGGVAAVVLGVVAVVGFALARSTTRPLRVLEQATTAVARGELEARAPTDRGPPEVRRLAVAFNDMAGQLGRLLEAQRAFVADASHQLRTPLTAMRLRLENLEETMPPAAADDLRAAIAETGRLARLVDGLLALARAEAAPGRREVVDLATAVADRQAAWGPLAAEQNVELTVQAGPAALVWAVPGAVEQVLDNLLANALRVAPAGSRIQLAIRPAGAWVELHVSDQGPGMAAEQRERALDRFWRGPATDQDGTGLGLAIVRQLLEASGGAAELRPSPGGGLDAVARLRPAHHDSTARQSGRSQNALPLTEHEPRRPAENNDRQGGT
jgi:signal transduction histidine kinase